MKITGLSAIIDPDAERRVGLDEVRNCRGTVYRREELPYAAALMMSLVSDPRQQGRPLVVVDEFGRIRGARHPQRSTPTLDRAPTATETVA